MAFRLQHSIILHIPKTGSEWVRMACKRSIEVPIEEISDHHANMAKVREELNGQTPLFITFVRHPVSWFQSIWKYWKDSGNYPGPCDGFELDEGFSFSDMVDHYIEESKEGSPVTEFFETYTGSEGSGDCLFVGRTENLVDDFVFALKIAGETFDEGIIRITGVQNKSATETPVMPPGLVRKVIRSEWRMMRRYGYPC
jgi:hypothetical protein